VRAFTALVNPISGGGKAAEKWAPLAGAIAKAGADVRVELTLGREHAVQTATAAAAEGRVVVAVGGDGLVRDAAEGCVAAGPSSVMGIVPAGRGNDLARALQLPTGADGLAKVLLHGEPRAMDVIDLDGTIVPGNVYCGIDSVANSLLNTNRWIPGSVLYRLAPVQAIVTWRPARFALTLDGVAHEVTGHSVVVGNSGAYGRGLRIVPSADPFDHRLDVLIVKDGPRRDIVSFMGEAKKGAHVHRENVEVMTAQEVTIAADRELPVCGDGENLAVTPARARLVPGALQMLTT
jgi:YegS/Rv2252/BmrU family lipid kinase